jgi:DNA-binding protein Fis
MKDPQELIENIAGIVRHKVEHSMKCFYSIKVSKNDTVTELIERRPASNDFLKDVQQIAEKHKPDALIVELWKGSSRKIKAPESEFFIHLKNRELSLPVQTEQVSGFDNSGVLAEMRRNFESQLQSVRELSGLHSTLTVSQMELKYKDEQIKSLREELEQAEAYIEQLEKDKDSRPQLNGPGGLNLIEIGGYLLEGFLRRNPALLGGALGMAPEQVTKLLSPGQGGQEQPTPAQGTATASVKLENEPTSEHDKIRAQVIDGITAYLRSLNDENLRKVYELMCASGRDLSNLDRMLDAITQENNSSEKDK